MISEVFSTQTDSVAAGHRCAGPGHRGPLPAQGGGSPGGLRAPAPALPETFRGGRGRKEGREGREGAGAGGGVGRGFSARPLPVLAAGLVDVPVGASAHLASLVLEQVLHPLALGRQLRLELVVHVSPMGGEGRAGRGTRRLISTRSWRSPLPVPPCPGLGGGGGRRERGGGAVCFCFGLGLFGGGGGGALRRRHPLQLGSSRRGARGAGSRSAAAGAGPAAAGGTP